MKLEENLQQTPPMLLLLRNCMGAHSPNFHSHLNELINYHKPAIIILTETKVNGLEADTIMGRFRKNLDDYSLLDLDFSRPRFTWSNLRQTKSCIMERLERCLANPD